MKKAILTLATTFLTIGLMADTGTTLKEIKSRLDDTDILKNWKLGEVKAVNGVSILRLEGENLPESRTNLFYLPAERMKELIEAKAENDLFTSTEKAAVLRQFEKTSAGGRLTLFLDREIKTLANTKLFSIVVKDENDEYVLYQQTLPNVSAEYYKYGIWFNIAKIDIPVEISRTSYVYVNDSGTNTSFKFKIIQPDGLFQEDEQRIISSSEK